MIIAVSDVHLGCKTSNRESFLRFLEKCDTPEIDHLVLLGDILDFWRRNNSCVTMENEVILEKLASLKAKNVHYVIGNHDYLIMRISKRYEDHYPMHVSRSLRLEDGGVPFYFIHGYELDVLANLEPLSIESYEKFCERMCFSEDVLGTYVSNLWTLFENRHGSWWKLKTIGDEPVNSKSVEKINRLACSRSKYVLLGMHPGERLVFGHTHMPFISDDNMVANTGCWMCDPVNSNLQNTYLKIDNGKMELKSFESDSFP